MPACGRHKYPTGRRSTSCIAMDGSFRRIFYTKAGWIIFIGIPNSSPKTRVRPNHTGTFWTIFFGYRTRAQRLEFGFVRISVRGTLSRYLTQQNATLRYSRSSQNTLGPTLPRRREHKRPGYYPTVTQQTLLTHYYDYATRQVTVLQRDSLPSYTPDLRWSWWPRHKFRAISVIALPQCTGSKP